MSHSQLWGQRGGLQNLSRLAWRGLDVSIAKEFAWRPASLHWLSIPVHKPSELNVHADAMPRLEAPIWAGREPLPKAMVGVPRTQAPGTDSLWKAWAPKAAVNPRKRRRGKVQRAATEREPQSASAVVFLG